MPHRGEAGRIPGMVVSEVSTRYMVGLVETKFRGENFSGHNLACVQWAIRPGAGPSGGIL